MIFTLVACGGTKVENTDKRPTIYISAFNGGYGIDWLNKMVSDYNAERTENAYQVAVRDSKDEFSTISGYINKKNKVSQHNFLKFATTITERPNGYSFIIDKPATDKIKAKIKRWER